MSSNLQRALWAESCVDHFASLTGVDDNTDAVADLIANLGHYCRMKDLDYLACVRTGIGHWHVEQIDPEFLGSMPDITITINESTHHAA